MPSTPPTTPLSIFSKPSRLNFSTRIALAIKLLQTKPPSLSIREFVILLRSHTSFGGRPLDPASERRHIEACKFWRERSEADAGRVHELQAKINELTETIAALSKANGAGLDKGCKPPAGSHDKTHAKKKSRVVNKGKSVPAVGAAKPTEKPSKIRKLPKDPSWISILEEGDFAHFSGLRVSKLISSLHLLQFAKEPHLIPKSIEQTSHALHDIIQDFIDGKLVRAISSAGLIQGAKESREIADFSKIIGKTCFKAISSLDSIAEDEAENKEFIACGIRSVIHMLVGILSLIYKNTQSLLSEALYPKDKPALRDIRLELTSVLIKVLKALCEGRYYQRDILEGSFHNFLEIINGILSQSSCMDKDDDDTMFQKLAVSETSWYFLKIFEAVLQVKSQSLETEERKLERQAMERLKLILINGIFGKTNDAATNESEYGKQEKIKGRRDDQKGFWENLEVKQPNTSIMVPDCPFSRELWGLLGFDMLAE